MKFKDTKYGDISIIQYQNNTIDVSMMNLTSLEGSPNIVIDNFDCSKNNLTSLEFAPKEIKGYFCCKGNRQIKNVKGQIIKYQIEAKEYWTDEGYFSFNDIKKFKALNKQIKSKGFRRLMGLDI